MEFLVLSQRGNMHCIEKTTTSFGSEKSFVWNRVPVTNGGNIGLNIVTRVPVLWHVSGCVYQARVPDISRGQTHVIPHHYPLSARISHVELNCAVKII